MRVAKLALVQAALIVGMPVGAQEAGPSLSVDEIVRQLTPEPPSAPVEGVRSVQRGNWEAPPGPTRKGVIPSLPVQFEKNSATLTPKAKTELDKLATALRRDELKGQRFRVSGHTDTVGSEEYNNKLSERRARSVAEHLATAGIEPERLEAVGMGERELADPKNPTSPVNRRVQIRTLQPSSAMSR